MIIKKSNTNKFYEFDSNKFTFYRKNKAKDYRGKLFIIGNRKYVLWDKDCKLLLQSKNIKIDVNNHSFKYTESKFFSYLFIIDNEDKMKHKLKHFKSIWEMLNISTYDMLEKIEDNNLYYLYDILKRFKLLENDKERNSFIY